MKRKINVLTALLVALLCINSVTGSDLSVFADAFATPTPSEEQTCELAPEDGAVNFEEDPDPDETTEDTSGTAETIDTEPSAESSAVFENEETEPSETAVTDETTPETEETETTEVTESTDATEPSAEETEPEVTVEPSVTAEPTAEPTAAATEEPTVTPVPTSSSSLVKSLVASDGKEYKITVTYDSRAKIPDGSELRVTEVDEKDYIDAAVEAMELTADDYIFYTKFLDITIIKDGVEIEPASAVTVKAELMDVDEGASELQVVHFTEDGAETLESDSTEDAVVTFETEAFSIYGFGNALHPVLNETTDEAELTILSFDEDSKVKTSSVSDVKEGLVSIKAYDLEDKDAKYWVKASLNDPDDSYESVAVYAINDNSLAKEPVKEITDSDDLYLLPENADGIAIIGDTGMRRLDLDAKDGDVKINGLMPKNATASATEVDTVTVDAILAYDITILDNGTEYQPGEEHPVIVNISDDRLTGVDNVDIIHIKDDGTTEQIGNVQVKDGQVTFAASGFSVYELVKGPNPLPDPDPTYAYDIADLTLTDDQVDAAKGFYLSIKDTTFVTNILNTNGAFEETNNRATASKWYLEEVSGGYKIYTYVGDNKEKMYIFDDPSNSVKVCLDSDGSVFEIKHDSAKNFTIKKKDEKKWLQHSGSGKGIRFYGDNNNVENSRFQFLYASSVDRDDPDPYKLNGKSYGIVDYNNSTFAHALTAETKGKDLVSTNTKLKSNPVSANGFNIIAEGESISSWTFHSTEGPEYKLSADVEGVTKYLKFTSNTLGLTEDPNEASKITLLPGSGENAGKIKLVCGGKAIYFQTDNKNGGTFALASSGDGGKNFWLRLADISRLLEDDFVVYKAKKAGISEFDPDTGEKIISNGSRVIVYTRIWNELTKSYDFYAVNQDGTLFPVYERGDDILWTGSQINTLAWNFTEYYYEGTTTPNNYYELQNEYSEKYLAPQIKEGQVLADKPIGINLPGRVSGDYYTKIIAWDDPYYAYAGLRPDASKTKLDSCGRLLSEDFYFAILESENDQLTEIATVDNTLYGIEIKMIDYSKNTVQNNILIDTTYDKEKPTQNILASNLTGDYPMVTAKDANGNSHSLSELFAGATTVNHLFIQSTYESSGYFEFDSCQNFATLMKNGQPTSDFTVYKELGTTDADYRTTMSHGQFLPYNSIQAGHFAEKNSLNLYSADARPENDSIGALPDSDPRKYEPLYVTMEKANYYNGMELSAQMVQTPSGRDSWGNDIVFEFCGDDDFWFYVDGELVLDLGGIHSALGGKVNFATGDVTVNGVETTLCEVFENNFKNRYIAEYKAAHNDAEPSQAMVNAAVNEYLDNYFDIDPATGKHTTVFKDYSAHTLRVFYMERGAGASNLHLRFNLSDVRPGQVLLSKNLEGVDEHEIDYSLVEFPYQIFYQIDPDGPYYLLDDKDEHTNKIRVTYQNSKEKVSYRPSYTVDNVTYENVFFVSHGKPIVIDVPADTINYYIKECGVDISIYDGVKVNGVPVTNTPETDLMDNRDYATSKTSAFDRPSVVFTNCVDPDKFRTLQITKKLYDSSGNEITVADDDTEFSYRLYLGNDHCEWDELPRANLFNYFVKDPNGYYCKWDTASQSFVSIGKTEYSSLTDEDKALITYATSPNGAISRIRAGYTVEVRNLIVGTRFRVEELESEMPAGYSLMNYSRVEGTFLAHESESNCGTVIGSQNPAIRVNNLRGWGLTAKKVWSDSSFTTDYDPIYFAIYDKDDQLVPDTLRQLVYPKTSTYYYFEDLKPGNRFEDYHLEEVDVTGDFTVGADGSVTGGTVSRIDDFLSIDARPKNSTERTHYNYEPVYETGTAVGSLDNRNIRVDTVTNSRTGGIVIRFNEWDYTTRLAGGEFTLKKADGEVVGDDKYVTGPNGIITVLYDFETNVDYVLTQTKAPKGYQGLMGTLTFRIDDSDNVTIVNSNDLDIEKDKCTKSDGSDKLIAYIDVRNKPYTLDAFKVDGTTGEPLEGVHFALYRQVKGNNGLMKDYIPIEGCEDLVTTADGKIPKIDQTLKPGVYYLSEKAAPVNYKIMDYDIKFTLDSVGYITIDDSQAGLLNTDTTSDTNRCTYTLNVPNVKEDSINLNITKKVTGGTTSQEFVFTLNSVEDETAGTSYPFMKTNKDSSVAQGLLTTTSGENTFTLADGETISIVVPKDKAISISEAAGSYKTSWKFGSDDPVNGRDMTVVLTETSDLTVTNDLDASFLPVPTGIHLGTAPMTILLLGSLILLGTAAVGVRKRRRSRSKIRKVTKKMLKGVV